MTEFWAPAIDTDRIAKEMQKIGKSGERTLSGTTRILSKVIQKIILRIIMPYSAEELKMVIAQRSAIISTIEAQVQDRADHPEKWTRRNSLSLDMTLKLMKWSRTLAQKFPEDLVLEYFNIKYATFWVKRERGPAPDGPEIVALVETPEGQAWLQQQINDARVIFGYPIEREVVWPNPPPSPPLEPAPMSEPVPEGS